MPSIHSEHANIQAIAGRLKCSQTSDQCALVCDLIEGYVTAVTDGAAKLTTETGTCTYDELRLIPDYLKYLLEHITNEAVAAVKR